MKTRKAWLADTVSLAMGNAAMLASGAILSLVSARWLGPEGKGELVLAFAVAALLAPVAAGGVDSFIAARGPALPPADRAGVLRLARRGALVGGTLLAATTVIYGIVNHLTPVVVALAAGAALLRPAVSVLQAAWTALDRVTHVGRVLAAMAVIQVVTALVLGIGGATPADFAAATAVAFGGGLVILARAVPKADVAPVIGPTTRRELFRFGGTVVASDALQLANYRIDLFFLAAFGTLAQVGVYVVAVSLAEILWQVPNAVSRSLLPRIHAGDVGMGQLLRLTRLLALAVAALGAVGWALTAGLAKPVLGDGFSQVPWFLALLLPGVVVLGAAKPLAAWVLSQGRPGRNLQASAVGFAVVIIADLVLIPRYGAAGAAVASTLSYVATAIAVVVLLPKRDAPVEAPVTAVPAGLPGAA